MSVGGTLYYLDMMSRNLSVAQNIDVLFFSKNAPLQKEYIFLYKSLFKESRLYQRVVETLSKQMKGMLERRDTFREVTGTKKTLLLTMVTSSDLVHNAGWQNIHNEVDIDDLFHA